MDFNHQANSYDTRAKLPDYLPKSIADALVIYTKISDQKTLLEVGTGTGEIGIEIANLPSRYIGFDKSKSMVNHFLKRYENSSNAPEILVADGNQIWSVANDSIDVVFSSKALHLIDNKHAIKELVRITGSNGLTLAIGSITKEPNSIDAALRKQMRHLLTQNNIKGKGGTKLRKEFYKECIICGAELLAPTIVAKWDIYHSPNDSIDAWRSVEGLAGNQVDDKLKLAIIKELEEWAYQEFGDLSKKIKSYKQYELSGVFFPKKC